MEKTIQQRILDAMESLLSKKYDRISNALVYVEFDNSYDCGCVDFITYRKHDNFVINSKSFIVFRDDGKECLDLSENISEVTIRLYKINDNGQTCIDCVSKALERF